LTQEAKKINFPAQRNQHGKYAKRNLDRNLEEKSDSFGTIQRKRRKLTEGNIIRNENGKRSTKCSAV
jgi:hypothetical protein